MTTFSTFVLVYVFGGITFVPLVVAAVLLHAYLTFPVRDDSSTDHLESGDSEEKNDGAEYKTKSELDSLPDQLKPTRHEPDVAAGYFAVCREYVPGGINGKPPERTTPAGAVVAAESPSVYQSMYRSIFDRNKSTTPTIDDGGHRKTKRARNVFFVVLRHGHLMLYDDAEQLEVRHVISLAYHDVDIYAGGEKVPEGELWIKRNCIRLLRKTALGEVESNGKPFFLFSDNSSQKEDFYLAMLRNQEHRPGSASNPPTPLHFDTAHIVKLVQQLHASEENLQTRWLNALIGRVFLGLYKTPDIEDFIRTKITKKISRVPKPNFISSIKLQKVDMGDCSPFFTNPKLKELTVDGDLTVEMDVKYKGNFRLEIAAVARIELGQRFKPREVTLILAGILKRLEGHILVRIKPPPSNRLWFSFETAPKMEMTLEPIVSSRQITYGVILRAIESRIREVMGDTLVYPNWDDIPFSDTRNQRFRGGVWADDANIKPLSEDQNSILEKNILNQEGDSDSDDAESFPTPGLLPRDKTQSMPTVGDSPPAGLIPRKPVKGMKSTISLDGASSPIAASSGAEIKSSAKPKAMRSGSFASAATPVVTPNSASVEALKVQGTKGQQDAASAMKTISRSQPASPVGSPSNSYEEPNMMDEVVKRSRASVKSTTSSKASDEDKLVKDGGLVDPERLVTSASPSFSTTPDTASISSNRSRHRQNNSLSLPRNTAFGSAEKRQSINQSVFSATAAAKKWFANRQQKHDQHGPSSTTQENFPHSPNLDSSSTTSATDEIAREHQPISASPHNPAFRLTSPTPSASPLGSPAHPIGRGQPLPPPGTPLPHPKDRKSNTWNVGAALPNFTKRKPVLPPRSPVAPRTGSEEKRDREDEGATSTSSLSGSGSPPKMGGPGSDKDKEEKEKEKERPSLNARRKSSITAPPLPPRWKRLSETRDAQAQGNRRDGDGMLVIEAPVADVSAPASPLVENSEEGVKQGIDDKTGPEEQGKVGNEKEGEDGEGDTEVFPSMELDDEVRQGLS